MTKYLIVTGGSAGIGEQTITAFVQNGWSAINISRSNCSVPHVENFNIDLVDPAWIAQHTDALRAAVKNAEVVCLVHNAAVFYSDSVADIAESEMRSVFEINVIAAMALNKIFLPHMPAGSAIIYIGSTLSEHAIANRASYVISKHAVVGLMRATCQDLARTGITTCCVCPGFVNTKMLTDAVAPDILAEVVQQHVTAGRLIEPEEIAEFIYFCATHPIVNGAVLHANLGQIRH